VLTSASPEMALPKDPEPPHALATPTPVDLQLTTQEDEAPPSPPLPSGARFARYVIRRLLGSGGMGEVYLAEDEQLGRMVALKRLAPRLIVSGPALERFRREARAASALNHPNVIAIYEAGDFEDQHYIASEFVEGRTLRHLLWERSLGLTQVLELVAQAAEALAAAHEAGIIHRDVKPENLMVRPDGWLKVLDFGLAKSARERLRPTAPDQTLAETAPNVIIGTVQYMSPEQARGQALDMRTDVWSLAVVAFELLTFQSPFARPTSTDTLAAILRDMPPPLPEPLRDVAGGHLERVRPPCAPSSRSGRPSARRPRAAHPRARGPPCPRRARSSWPSSTSRPSLPATTSRISWPPSWAARRSAPP
jgi:serine/threonine protein kinase